MIGKIKNKLKKEDGAVQIVEATVVFPIMFIILLFLIYMGNAFYIKAQVEATVAQKAIAGANYCADPILQTIKETGSVPNIKDLQLDPYRYFTGMNGVEMKIKQDVKKEIDGSTASFFKNMSPVVKTSDAKYNNYLLYATFSVEVQCELEFPIKFFGEATPPVFVIRSRSEVAVNDTAEFIRNTDMVIDYFGDTNLGRSIQSVFEKVNTFISNFPKKQKSES